MIDYNVLLNNRRTVKNWQKGYIEERLKTAVPTDFHPDRVAFILEFLVGNESFIRRSFQRWASGTTYGLAIERATTLHDWSKHVRGISILAPHDLEAVMRELVTADVYIRTGRIEGGHAIIATLFNAVMETYS